MTASSSTEPVAESAIHCTYAVPAPGTASSVLTSIARRGVRQAMSAQRTANAANSQDQIATCCTPPKNGSTRNG